ncbi:MAG TPA: MATE family efflux transporter [Candidatus Borkfalkia excrementigallinarum]|uniref:Multidrug export protein MepA n=1 Tax=Candidatus Borkfalkia excrementigallinarum TaxID=2838506 RepID=A0A9D1ZVE4_9FIRM|nr:MATE family efflux transporter [Candidatus Borkfalkia excrementigallinarum]
MKALDLGSPRVLPTVLKLVIPAMIAQFINVLYSIVDRMYVGNIAGIGDTALAAVGVCAPITTLISSFAFLIGTGGAPLFAMALGEGKEETSKKILTNALYSLAAIALIVTAIVFAFEKPLLMTFGASGSTYAYARQYLLIYAAGALFSITATGLNQYITAQGYSGMGMLTTVIGAAANIALDPLFIFVFRMNVAGAALATVLSQFLSFLFVAVFLLLKSTKIRLSLGRASLRLIGKIVKLGISPFIIMATDSVIIIVSNAVLQSRGGADGDLWITVSTVVQAFFQLITMPMMGISTGSQPVISYNYGAKNTALIKKAEKYITALCLGFTVFMTLVSLFAAGPFVSLFTSNAEIASRSVWGIRIFMIGVIPLSFQYAFVDGLTALGQPQYAIVLSLTRKLIVYLGCILVLPVFWGAQAVFYAEPAADICAAILSSAVFLIVFPKILKKREACDAPA